MAPAYSAREADEIGYNFRTVLESLAVLHPRLRVELERATETVTIEVSDPTFAQVLVTAELQRGINRDARARPPAASSISSPRLRLALNNARAVGTAVAPFALRDMRQFLRSHFGRSHPGLNREAKEAILRCQMIHAGSQQGAPSTAMANRSEGRARTSAA